MKTVLWKQVKVIIDSLAAIIRKMAPDWNAAEGEAGYVANRTHYKIEGGVETLIPETTPTYSEEGGAFYLMGEQPFPTIGETYTILWNGVEYECEAIGVGEGGLTAVGFGNLGAMGMGDETGEPFAILIIPPEALESTGGIGAQIAALDGSAAVTFSIYRSTTVCKKLDYEYMPKGYPSVRRGVGDLLPETAFENEGLFITGTELAESLIPGNTYTVNWNGVDYETTAVQIIDTENQFVLVALGNTDIFTAGTATSDPFCIFDPKGTQFQDAYPTARIVAQAFDGSTSVTVKITGEIDIVIEMDERFTKTAIANATKNVMPLYESENFPFAALTVPVIVGLEADGKPVAYALPKAAVCSLLLGDASANGNIPLCIGGDWRGTIQGPGVFSSPDNGATVNGVILASTTAGSTKYFKITVDDSGTISATEVT